MYVHLLLKLCCITRRAQNNLFVNQYTLSIHVSTDDLIGWQCYTGIWTYLASDVSPGHFHPDNVRTFSSDKYPPNKPHGHAPPRNSPWQFPYWHFRRTFPRKVFHRCQLSVTAHGLLLCISTIAYDDEKFSYLLRFDRVIVEMLIPCFPCVG